MVKKQEVIDAIDHALDLARKSGEQNIGVRGGINKLENAKQNLAANLVCPSRDSAPVETTTPLSQEEIDELYADPDVTPQIDNSDKK